MTQAQARRQAVIYSFACKQEIADQYEHAAHDKALLAAHYGFICLHLRRATANRRARADAYESCGMVRVRGALGGVYYE